MKILFIGKYYFYENTAIMLLCGYLKKHGYDCLYLDLKFERNILKEVQKISPDIIAYNLVAGSEIPFLKVNSKLKKNVNFFSVFGGPYCMVFPEIINEKDVDAVCIGEGEEALLELVTKLDKNKSINDIKSFWIKNAYGEVFKNEVRKLNENIDSISIADRSIFDKYSLYKNLKRRNIITTRGCPFNCSFCYNDTIKKTVGISKYGYRQRSVDNVILELNELVKKYAPKKIKFIDDTSFLNKNWTFDFLQRYRDEIKIPFIACVRIETLNEDMVIAMKKAGCLAVEFGIECGDEKVRKELLNRNISNSIIIQNSLILRKHGIKTMSLNMFALPNETISQALSTLKINIESKVSFAHSVIYTPVPRTKLGDYVKENGLFDGDINKINYKFMYADIVLQSKIIKETKRLQYISSTIIAFPFLFKFTNTLIKLPLISLYKFLFYIHRVMNHFFITKQLVFSDFFIINRKTKAL